MISMLNAKLTKAEQKLGDLREELFFAYDSSAVQMMEPQRGDDRGYSRERSPIYRYEQPLTVTIPRNERILSASRNEPANNSRQRSTQDPRPRDVYGKSISERNFLQGQYVEDEMIENEKVGHARRDSARK
jgi:hypothetical protein